MASAQYCDPGATTTCDDVLVVCAVWSSFCQDVRSKLQSTAAFSTVDTFDASSGTPTLSQLKSYHAVLAFSSDYSFADASLLGDVLAAYHDQGGGVVVAHYANAARGTYLRGVYGTVSSGYALMDYAEGSYILPSDSLGDVLEPQSPLMYGVASLYAEYALRSTAPIVAGRGVVVARWQGGGQEPLVLRGMRGNRTLVEVNMFPVSSSAYSGWWTGDGAQLLRNGLKYSRCMVTVCEAGTYAVAGGG
jgi:hypothetical protein